MIAARWKRPGRILRLDDVLVPPLFRKCVVYLESDIQDRDTGVQRATPIGTAFFVQMPMKAQPKMAFTYLVTARHVVDASRPYGELWLRLNRDDGTTTRARAPQDNWTLHPRSDVAAVIIGFKTSNVVFTPIPIEMFADDAMLDGYVVGEGDEVMMVGLFNPQPGSARNEPITRFGHIALMPYDPIPIKMDPAPGGARVPVKAYLLEALAYGGQSGSPVFLWLDSPRVPGRNRSDDDPVRGAFSLLGLVHGHYPHRETVAVTEGGIVGRGKIDFNLGVSVAIPAQDIRDLLESEDLMKEREEMTKRYLESEGESGPKPDAAVGDEESEYDRFEGLARRLVNTPKPKPDEDES